MEYYDDYDDFSLGGKLYNKGTIGKNKKDSGTCYSSKHVRRVTSISQAPKTK